MWQYTRWPVPTISTSSTSSWSSDRLVVSLIFSQGISHYFTNIQDTTYTTVRVEEKKSKQAQTWVSSKCKMGEVCDTLMWFSVHLAIASTYPSRISTQPPGTLIHPLALADLASESTGSNSSLSSCLSLTIAFPQLLLTALGPCLSSSFSGLIGDLTRKPFMWVSHQNRQRNLTGTHPQKWIPNIMPQRKGTKNEHLFI